MTLHHRGAAGNGGAFRLTNFAVLDSRAPRGPGLAHDPQDQAARSGRFSSVHDVGPPRIAITSLMQETNTFSPIPTTRAVFETYYVLHGDELLHGYGAARVEVPGFLDVLHRAGATPVPLFATYAAAAGSCTRETFEAFMREIESRLADALPLDGLLLALHGALVLTDEPDGEGEIIERMRAILPADKPIGVSLDLHGHITPRMLQPNTFLIGYQNYPHTDIYETGERTARLMLDTVAGRRRPAMALAKRPVIVTPVCARTTDGPLKPVADLARRMEAEGKVLHASIFPVQPWIDVPDLGFAALVCADGDTTAAQRAAERLADALWQRRADFAPDLRPLDEAIAIGLASPGVTVVSDTGDAPTGGATADSPAVLAGLLAGGAAEQPRLSLAALCDPAAAEAAHRAGLGANVSLTLGHAFTPGTPLAVTATVANLSDGTYVMRDRGTEGLMIRMGPTAVLAIGSIRLLVRSHPSTEWDTAMYTSQGLEPRDAALVFVKSPSHFRASFGPLADRILLADTPGPTCGDMRRIPFRHATRPLYPLDEI
jgi:microcystin degradation protein MlrC